MLLAAVSASAAAHEFARRAPAGSAESWLAQGHLRAAQGWCSLAFADDEEAGPASKKALAAAANCAAAVKGEGVEGDPGLSLRPSEPPPRPPELLLLGDTNLCAIHAKRVTIYTSVDLHIVYTRADQDMHAAFPSAWELERSHTPMTGKRSAIGPGLEMLNNVLVWIYYGLDGRFHWEWVILVDVRKWMNLMADE
ncbi:hypothetical protein PG984_014885 [Apiospora sp. TS-2023a]